MHEVPLKGSALPASIQAGAPKYTQWREDLEPALGEALEPVQPVLHVALAPAQIAAGEFEDGGGIILPTAALDGSTRTS